MCQELISAPTPPPTHPTPTLPTVAATIHCVVWQDLSTFHNGRKPWHAFFETALRTISAHELCEIIEKKELTHLISFGSFRRCVFYSLDGLGFFAIKANDVVGIDDEHMALFICCARHTIFN